MIPEAIFTLYSLAGIVFICGFSTVIHSGKFQDDIGELDCLFREKNRVDDTELRELWSGIEDERRQSERPWKGQKVNHWVGRVGWVERDWN